MIIYDVHIESWVDTEDNSWTVDMTPEVSSEIDLEFQSRKEFYSWYYNQIPLERLEKSKKGMLRGIRKEIISLTKHSWFLTRVKIIEVLDEVEAKL